MSATSSSERHQPSDRPDHREPHHAGLASRLNWLRAGVLGANDGIVSTAAIVLGVAGATDERGPIILAGLVGRGRWALIAGTVLQILIVVAGIAVPALYILGVIFAAFWFTGIWMANRLEQPCTG